jgi:hypothetical protein
MAEKCVDCDKDMQHKLLTCSSRFGKSGWQHRLHCLVVFIKYRVVVFTVKTQGMSSLFVLDNSFTESTVYEIRLSQ